MSEVAAGLYLSAFRNSHLSRVIFSLLFLSLRKGCYVGINTENWESRKINENYEIVGRPRSKEEGGAQGATLSLPPDNSFST